MKNLKKNLMCKMKNVITRLPLSQSHDNVARWVLDLELSFAHKYQACNEGLTKV
jgi:hypothetical protein